MSPRSLGASWLTWKLEDSPGSSSDDDVGPAWVHGDDGSVPHTSGPALEGRWITRREARAIAEEHGLRFFEDDGRAPEHMFHVNPVLDLDAINRKLRAAGISATELRVEAHPGFDDVLVWGTLLQSLPENARDPDSPFTTAMVSMSPAEAFDALDQLVPQWRSAG